MNYLIVTSPDGTEKSYSLAKGEISVGRDNDNDVVLPVAGVSRRHARIYTWEEQVFVEDLGSSNGIFINRKRITEAVVIRPGVPITIDQFTLVVRGREDEGDEAAWGMLVGKRAPVTGETHVLDAPEIFVGRTEDNHIVLIHQSISRRHASLRFDKGGPRVVDLDSSNGTTINGKRIKEAALGDGCQVTFGQIEFEFRLPGAAAAGTSPARAGAAPGPAGAGTAGFRFGKTAIAVAVTVFLVLAMVVVAGAIKKRRTQQKSLDSAQIQQKASTAEEFAREKVDRARSLIDKERWDEALSEAKAALDKDPLNQDAAKLKKAALGELDNKRVFEKGEKHLAFGKLEDARDKFARIPRKSAYSARAAPRIKEIDRKRSMAALAEVKAMSRRGDPRKLHEALCRALDIDPDNAEALRMLRNTEASLRKKKIRFVEWKPPVRSGKDDLYSLGTVKDPDTLLQSKYPDERIRKGMVLYYRGKPDEAMREFTKLLQDKKAKDIDKGKVEGLQGEIFFAQGKFKEAQGHMLQNNVKEAARFWKNVLETDAKLVPVNPPSHYRDEIQRQLAESYVKAGSSLYDKGRYEEAFEQIRQGFEVAPDNIEVLNALRKLDRTAERLFEDAFLNPAQARKNLQSVTAMTLPAASIHKMAQQRLRELR
ncbi:MAG: FHA domain-containing protein [Deltaproteobacteria bacterium]|nr:FHA domain-containing protein [Deltaproteobacteria bacterium]